MNNSHARQILETLRDGIDPITREPLAVEHPLAEVPVVIALEMAIQALEKVCLQQPIPNNPRSKQRTAVDSFRAWNDDEQGQLAELYGRSVPISKLAILFQRSVTAIRARLIGLGILKSHISSSASFIKGTRRQSPATKNSKAVPWWRKVRPNAGKPWSEQERITLRKCADQGMSETAIGKVLGRGEKSIGVQLLKLGIRLK